MTTQSIITQTMRDAIGVESEPATHEVEKGAIVKFAQAIGDTNPIFCDEAAARRTRYGGLVAPPTFLRSMSAGAARAEVRSPYPAALDGGSEWEYFEPVRPGDRITVVSKVADVFERQGRLGNMLFTIRETRYVNQFGVVAATQRSTGISYQPSAGGGQAQAAVSGGFKTAPVQEKRAERAQVYFEDVLEGMELPTLTKHPTTQQLVKYAGASGDYYQIHYDLEYARANGLPNVVLHGALKSAFLGQLMTDWTGEWGALKKLSCQYRGLDVPGFPVYCKGTVTRKYAQNGDNLVECDIWLENSKGEKTTPGRAIVTLPSRKS